MYLSECNQPNQHPSKEKGGGSCGFSELVAVWHHFPSGFCWWVSVTNSDCATVFRVILNWSNRETSRPGACKRRPHVTLARFLYFFSQTDEEACPLFFIFHLLKGFFFLKPQMDVWNRSRWFCKTSICHIRWIQSLKKNRRRRLVAGR